MFILILNYKYDFNCKDKYNSILIINFILMKGRWLFMKKWE